MSDPAWIDRSTVPAEDRLRSPLIVSERICACSRRLDPVVSLRTIPVGSFFSLIIIVSRTVPGGIVSAIVPGWIVCTGGSWTSWTGWHALRFRIVEREMYGLGLLDLGCVDYTSVRAQRSRRPAVAISRNK